MKNEKKRKSPDSLTVKGSFLDIIGSAAKNANDKSAERKANGKGGAGKP